MSPTLVMLCLFGIYFFIGIFPAVHTVLFARSICHKQFLCRSSIYYCSLFLISLIGWSHFAQIIRSTQVQSEITEFILTEPSIWRWLFSV